MGKRVVCWILLACFWMNLAGCGMQKGDSLDAKDTALPESRVTEAAQTLEPTTAPTLSREEQLMQTLPERMRQAYEAGLVELEQLEDLERTVTLGEAAAMLQKAYVHRTGTESQTLKELAETPDYANVTATKGLLSGLPGLADIELAEGEFYESYEQWLEYATGDQKKSLKGRGDSVANLLMWTYPYRLSLNNLYLSNLFLEQGDMAEAVAAMEAEPLYCAEVGFHQYAQAIYDDTNGKKYIGFDEDGNFHAFREMTMAEVTECALVYYNYPNPMAIPTFLAAEEVGPYNPDIITADLLSKDTDLPEASCQQLPAQWHGVLMQNWSWQDEVKRVRDGEIYEYEIQAVKEAGFNYIGLELDFSWLQDAWLFKSDEPYKRLVNSEDQWKLSLERLEKLDQVIAWCMKYDIHLNLRITSPGNTESNNRILQTFLQGKSGEAASFAKNWQALARRYADIPNTYLSFTIFTEQSYNGRCAQNSAILPAVDAIREVSPERCIIADAYHFQQRYSHSAVEAFAQKGVALSYNLQITGTTVLAHWDLYKYNMKRSCNELIQEAFIKNFAWPYEGIDGEAALAQDRWGAPSFDEVMATAEEYGVGFMLSSFGVTAIGVAEWPDYRYPDESYRAMITDIISAVESRGYGWCFGNWYGYFGICDCVPQIADTTYEQVEDYPYYIDQTMLGWFREINSIA